MFKKIIMLSSLFAACTAFAHPGGVDANGCHKQRGVQHCHDGNGANAKELKQAQNSDKERRAGHKLQCRGAAGVKGSQPSYDLQGQPCKPSEKAR
jgi:hypothetical protein